MFCRKNRCGTCVFWSLGFSQTERLYCTNFPIHQGSFSYMVNWNKPTCLFLAPNQNVAVRMVMVFCTIVLSYFNVRCPEPANSGQQKFRCSVYCHTIKSGTATSLTNFKWLQFGMQWFIAQLLHMEVGWICQNCKVK